MSARKPSPPTDFQSWLDYAVANLDVRGAYLDRIFDQEDVPSQDSIRAAALDELDQLKQKAIMPWIGMLENWQVALSKKLGRPAAEIVEHNLLPTDFPKTSVLVQFNDGSRLMFRRAFFVGEKAADAVSSRMAIFSEYCGYHEFWLGPKDQISEGLKFDGQHASAEDLAWDSMAPIGGEFGSPDFDRLMEEDAEKFGLDLAQWIQESRASNVSLKLEGDEVSDTRNVQLALHQLGQDVSLEDAACVWKRYSQSLMASWMSGAETVQSAARTIYLNCPRSATR